MDVSFCLEALDQALEVARPDIFNTDQGHSSPATTSRSGWQQQGFSLVWTGGTALDNVFVERLWRTVKYEEVYLKDYETPREDAG